MSTAIDQHPTAPPWHVTQWFNTETWLPLNALRGKVIALHASQMLCPGCVQHGLPQAQKVHELFSGKERAVIGL